MVGVRFHRRRGHIISSAQQANPWYTGYVGLVKICVKKDSAEFKLIVCVGARKGSKCVPSTVLSTR